MESRSRAENPLRSPGEGHWKQRAAQALIEAELRSEELAGLAGASVAVRELGALAERVAG